jgi:hypothetical protein
MAAPGAVFCPDLAGVPSNTFHTGAGLNTGLTVFYPCLLQSRSLIPAVVAVFVKLSSENIIPLDAIIGRGWIATEL